MEPACLLTHPANGPYAAGQAGQHDRYDAVRATTTALAAPLSPCLLYTSGRRQAGRPPRATSDKERL